jgi:DNA-binding MarR family transcriptional regulator
MVAQSRRDELTAVKPSSQAGGIIEQLAWLVPYLYFDMKSVGDRMGREIGQTSARLAHLREFALAEPITVAQLAKRLHMDRQPIQRIAHELAADELIEFIENPNHTRSRLVRLTHKGWPMVIQFARFVSEWADLVGEGFDSREVATTARILTRTRERIEELRIRMSAVAPVRRRYVSKSPRAKDRLRS